MIEVFNIINKCRWDAVVKSFVDFDVYYLSGYVRAFMLHGDGEPCLLYYDEEGLRAIYVFMRRKTAIEGVFDSITPYGYGGVLFEGDASEKNKRAFWAAYLAKMKELNIIDNFVRYHPVLANAAPMKGLTSVIDLGKTVAMDLTSPEVIWDNIHSKNRNMIRKAEKNGIVIRHGKGLGLFKEFRKIYNATMQKDNAEEYYYFGEAFYESIHNDLHDNYEMFWAEIPNEGCEGGVRIIAMSIMIFANGRLNYHLSGSDIEYRNLAPSNLLLYKTALWGCEQGMKTFHLGGGVGSGEDNLYKFKVAFNKNSDYQFSIGKEVFAPLMYDKLVEERAARDSSFDREGRFFPVYRV